MTQSSILRFATLMGLVMAKLRVSIPLVADAGVCLLIAASLALPYAKAAQMSAGPATGIYRQPSLALAPFPRLMGMNIGTANYLQPGVLNRITKLDIVILGFYPGWHENGRSMGDVVRVLRTMNPHLLIGQYTVLDGAYKEGLHWFDNDIARKLERRDWWLRTPSGHVAQWSAEYDNYDTNFTKWTHPDSKGRRYPQWLAEHDYKAFFKSGMFNIWYFDDVNYRPRLPFANWKQDGRMQESHSQSVEHAYRQGQADEWAAARQLDPNILFMGNADNDLHYPSFRNKLQGAFLEGLMGYKWSLMTWGGWGRVMRRYHAIFHNLAYPKIVGFNVAGSPRDYRFFRFAFASCLMDNGYFSFTDKKKMYTSVPWFDEYNIKLGQPTDPPQLQPWQNGVYRRRFQYGMALVNPTTEPRTVAIPPGYRRFYGQQDPRVNNGLPVSQLTLPPRDGIILVTLTTPP